MGLALPRLGRGPGGWLRPVLAPSEALLAAVVADEGAVLARTAARLGLRYAGAEIACALADWPEDGRCHLRWGRQPTLALTLTLYTGASAAICDDLLCELDRVALFRNLFRDAGATVVTAAAVAPWSLWLPGYRAV